MGLFNSSHRGGIIEIVKRQREYNINYKLSAPEYLWEKTSEETISKFWRSKNYYFSVCVHDDKSLFLLEMYNFLKILVLLQWGHIFNILSWKLPWKTKFQTKNWKVDAPDHEFAFSHFARAADPHNNPNLLAVGIIKSFIYCEMNAINSDYSNKHENRPISLGQWDRRFRQRLVVDAYHHQQRVLSQLSLRTRQRHQPPIVQSYL